MKSENNLCDLAKDVKALSTEIAQLKRLISQLGAVDIPRLLTPKTVSEITGLKESTLTTMRSRGKGPKYKKVEGKVMYLPSAVADYISKC